MSVSTGKGSVDAWAEVFDVPESVAGLDRQHEVAKLLSALT